MKLSVVSPVYRAENIVEELVKRVTMEASAITDDFEIILVEDAGGDKSWEKIEECCKKEKRVVGIKLARNFGQHFAITAGLEHAKGDIIIVMDCDLQDDPKYFKELVNRVNEGYHIVYTQKTERKHDIIKNLTAKIFYITFNYLIGNSSQKASGSVGTYSALSRAALNAFNSFGDYKRHYLMVLRWLGLKHTHIVVEHQQRFSGESSYNWKKLIEHAIDGITSQSDKLLRLTAGFGFLLSSFSFISALGIVISYFIKPFQAGWASIAVLILFMSGLIILSIGICGIYIGKIFEQTKNRPRYIIETKLN